MTRLLLTTALAISLSACATTNIAKSANMAKKAVTAQKIVQGTSDLVASNDPAPVTKNPVAISSAQPISATPLTITSMKKTNGKTNVLSMQSKIAIAGYNIASVIDATAKGKASGDLLGYSQGSRTTVQVTAEGITPDIIERIATAAHDDLVAQLSAAGFDVIPAGEVATSSHSSTFQFTSGPVDTKIKVGRGSKTAIVNGPKGIGVRNRAMVGKSMFGGGNWVVKPSSDMSAVVLSPDLVLDYAAVKASKAQLTTKSSASITTQFAIDPSSSMNMNVSRGRFLDGWLNYGITKPVGMQEQFGVLQEGKTKTNALEQGLGLALGMATAAKKKKSSVLVIDPVRYEQLGLKAAKGWNKAFVEKLVEAKAS